ncbi:MAG: SRPBCC family protein [Tepidiformaceae bacterium]
MPAPVTISTPTDLEVAIHRVFKAPRQLLWDCHTKPELIRRWLLGPDGWTMPVCEVDLRPGGKWHWVWRKDDGAEMAMTGEYRVIDEPFRLTNTECWGVEWPETLNTIILVERDGATELTSSMIFPSKEARDAALATGMADGANQSYDRLDGILAELVA